MAFEGLSDKLGNVFKKLRSHGKLTEADVKEAMREVRMALLEADVSYKVVKDFVAKVSARAVGEEVLNSLTPAQQVVKIVNEELCALMGNNNARINFPSKPPCVIMFCGLQGSGKTTHAAKLAKMLKKEGHYPLLVACDIYRPAAIHQLQVVGERAGVKVFEMGQISPMIIAKEAMKFAKDHGHDVVILDTAGRLHIDLELMEELKQLKELTHPDEIMLVVDAMTGQDAVNVAKAFDDALGIDSVLMSKLDSDTRGGAALSVLAVTGKPIKYVGMGEKLDDFEPFHPERMASRILGMGDVLSLIDKVQANIDEQEALDMAKKMRANDFTLEDFLAQMQQIKKMGPLKDLLGMMPGIPGMGKLDLESALNGVDPQKEMARTESIIQSMTKEERANPSILNGPRKKLIAAGCGRSIADVNRLIKQFEEMKKMMKQMNNMQKGKKGKFPFFR